MKFLVALAAIACLHVGSTRKLRAAPPAQLTIDHAKAEEGVQSPQKVTIQMTDAEVDAFLGKLSPGCKTQYTAMFSGKGSGLHTFGAPGTQSTADTCKTLEGALCETRAHVVQQTHNGSGRVLSTNMEVRGKGCLPKSCIAKHDLVAVTSFMHKKAQGSGKIPGEGVDLDLHVDCSGSGGSEADAYLEKTTDDDDDDDDDEHHGEHHEEHHEEPHEEHHEEKHEEKHDEHSNTTNPTTDHHEQHEEEHHEKHHEEPHEEHHEEKHEEKHDEHSNTTNATTEHHEQHEEEHHDEHHEEHHAKSTAFAFGTGSIILALPMIGVALP